MMLWEAAKKIIDAVKEVENAGFSVEVKDSSCQCCNEGVIIRDDAGREMHLRIY